MYTLNSYRIRSVHKKEFVMITFEGKGELRLIILAPY